MNRAEEVHGLERGLFFAISAPAGAGKTTLAEKLVKEFPQSIKKVITCATRAPRGGEKDGVHYHFLSVEEFEQGIQEKAFLEYAKVYDRYYGIRSSDVDAIRDSGKHALVVVDVQGAESLRTTTDVITIFIEPPSIEELESRMVGRGLDDPKEIKKRLEVAEKEMAEADKFDYLVINDDLDVAYQTLRSIIIAEEQKVSE